MLASVRVDGPVYFTCPGANHEVLDRSVAYTCFLRGRANIPMWFEYVESKGNWSDAISRLRKESVRKRSIPAAEFQVCQSIWLCSVEECWERAKALLACHSRL